MWCTHGAPTGGVQGSNCTVRGERRADGERFVCGFTTPEIEKKRAPAMPLPTLRTWYHQLFGRQSVTSYTRFNVSDDLISMSSFYKEFWFNMAGAPFYLVFVMFPF